MYVSCDGHQVSLAVGGYVKRGGGYVSGVCPDEGHVKMRGMSRRSRVVMSMCVSIP